jgi:hypothetical protein
VPEYTVALYGTDFSVVSFGYSPEKVVDGLAIVGNELYDFSKSTNGCNVYLGFGNDFNRDLAKTEIVMSDTNGLFRSRPADPTNICSRAVTMVSSKANARNPVTDGTNVVFQWGTNIFANIDGRDEVLADWPLFFFVPYAVNAGWIAFPKPGTTGQQQIWTRSPAGQFEQRTFFSVGSYLESLNSDGTVTFQIYNQGGPPVGRYLSLPGTQPVWINSGQGRVKWEAGVPYLMIGRSAFRIRLASLQINSVDAQAIRLQLRSPVGLRFSIQQSLDLLMRTETATITNMSGAFSITNGTTNLSSMFFRAVHRP